MDDARPLGLDAENRFGMVIDVNRCVGCQTCTVACKHQNDTPPMVQWRKVLDVELGEYPDVARLFLVVGCQHCAEPPCVPVCPTGATAQRADGLVTMNYDTCIGCGYCAVACPYQARTIVHEKEWYYGAATRQETAVAHDDRIGVMTKCTFCVEKVDEAKERGLTPGVDLDVTPACAASCIASAITFGDFADPDSNVSTLVRERPSFQMHEELGTDPQIKYLYDAPATPGRDADPSDADDDRLLDPRNPLAGKKQTFWDYRAAMNFTLGGMASGLMVIAYLTMDAPQRIYAIAAALMAVGLWFVFLEIGRKLRFLYVLKRPQSSWMTRETYVVAVVYPAVVADFLWPHPALHALVALAGAAFLYCQARILYAGKGIPAWRAPLVPWMLIATGLFEGAGLLCLIEPTPGMLLPAIGFALALVNAALWRAFVTTAKDRGIPPLARAELDAATPALHMAAHALPAVLFGLVLFAPFVPATANVLLAVAGVAAVCGGVLLKFTLVLRASYQQGFAMPTVPRRGSGTRAAPARLSV
jgi:Fe-S-cluster-containing dehydrogenase component/DMSO reductase anchor subunit